MQIKRGFNLNIISVNKKIDVNYLSYELKNSPKNKIKNY